MASEAQSSAIRRKFGKVVRVRMPLTHSLDGSFSNDSAKWPSLQWSEAWFQETTPIVVEGSGRKPTSTWWYLFGAACCGRSEKTKCIFTTPRFLPFLDSNED